MNALRKLWDISNTSRALAGVEHGTLRRQDAAGVNAVVAVFHALIPLFILASAGQWAIFGVVSGVLFGPALLLRLITRGQVSPNWIGWPTVVLCYVLCLSAAAALDIFLGLLWLASYLVEGLFIGASWLFTGTRLWEERS